MLWKKLLWGTHFHFSFPSSQYWLLAQESFFLFFRSTQSNAIFSKVMEEMKCKQPFSITNTHTHSLSHTHIHTHKFSLSSYEKTKADKEKWEAKKRGPLLISPTFNIFYSKTHTHSLSLSLSFSLSLFNTHQLSHAHSLSLFNTHQLSHAHTLFLSCTTYFSILLKGSFHFFFAFHSKLTFFTCEY